MNYICLDSRGIFIIIQPQKFYIWCGSKCFDEKREKYYFKLMFRYFKLKKPSIINKDIFPMHCNILKY